MSLNMAGKNLENLLLAKDLSKMTLEETYDRLKEVEKESHNTMEQIIDRCMNNQVETISPEITPEEIQFKKNRMIQNLLNNDYDYDSRMRPVIGTEDIYKLTNWELDQKISNFDQVIQSLKEKIKISKSNISYLEKEINGLERMREVCTDATESVADDTYDAEIFEAKKMFKSVKADLSSVVELLLPNHDGFSEVLMDITRAHAKGGDDMYIDVNPLYDDIIEFLVESDIVMYHRNDKSKVRLMDLV